MSLIAVICRVILFVVHHEPVDGYPLCRQILHTVQQHAALQPPPAFVLCVLLYSLLCVKSTSDILHTATPPEAQTALDVPPLINQLINCTGCSSTTQPHAKTRHRASTSTYSLTFCVHFLLPATSGSLQSRLPQLC